MCSPPRPGVALRLACALLALVAAACGDNATTSADDAEKSITAFAFLSANNADLAADVTASISGTEIAATVPFGTDVTALVASFEHTGDTVEVAGLTQVTGTTSNDFSIDVTYTVTARDGSTASYRVRVTAQAADAKELTAFAFLDATNAALSADVTATITGDAIAATVPFGTEVTELVATFTTTGASVAVGTTPQVSGTTSNDFTSAVTYTVTAADSTTRDYTVTVTVAPSMANDLTAFSFAAADNAGLAADVIATITGTDIAATVPFGTDVSTLIATFTTTGQSVTVGTTAQVSATTPNDFTTPVAYTVTAADSSTKDYTVTVTVAENSAKDLTRFELLDADNTALDADYTATITGAAIALELPPATDVTALIASFDTTGAAVAVATVAQTSGTTANDFTTPAIYVVTAADGSTQSYTVTITLTPAPAPELLAFGFLDGTNPALDADVTATITGTDVSATVPFGTDVTALVATFTIEGVTVTVGGTAQDSGATSNDFTSPVDYTVNGLEAAATYTVTVTIAPLADPACGDGVVDATEECDDDNEADGDGCSATCTFEYLTAFSFTGSAGGDTTYAADETTPTSGIASVPVMQRGGGIASASATNTFSASGWTSGATIDANDYYTFTLTPATGFAMTFTHLEVSEQRSATGPTTFAVRSSLDGFTTSIDVQGTHITKTPNTIALGAGFANLATAVEFRIYGYAADAGTGTWRIDDVRVGGFTVAAPTP